MFQPPYRVIVVDPPWNQGKTGKRLVRPNQSLTLDYPTMKKDELLAMPILSWAESQSFLWLWATNSKDRATGQPILAMAFELLQTWGFTYYTMITWDKKTGPCPFGPYQIVTEHVLFGYRGKVIFSKEILGKMKNIFTETPSGRHSEKPASFYTSIALHFAGPRLDVFARRHHEGFDGWGNEYCLNEKEEKGIDDGRF